MAKQTFTADALRQIAIENLKQVAEQGGINKKANARFKGSEASRNNEWNADLKRAKPKFITTSDINKMQNYDVGQVFEMTYGNQGATITLTADDLKAFKSNIDLLAGQYLKGITAKQVIDSSLPIDIQRSNEQIFLATPISRKDGLVHFLTNASRENGAINHHVNVEFLAFQQLANFGADKKTAKNLLNFGKLKFECDCGRHDYWYRYIATIGGYGAGRQEHGYPKIRNQYLSGVACKHVLRVMQYIRSPMGINYMWQQLQKTAQKQTVEQQQKRQTQTKQQIQKQIDELARKKTKAISGDHDAVQKRLLERMERMAKAAQHAAQKQAERAAKNGTAYSKKKAESQLQSMINTFGKAEVEAMLKAMKGGE